MIQCSTFHPYEKTFLQYNCIVVSRCERDYTSERIALEMRVDWHQLVSCMENTHSRMPRSEHSLALASCSPFEKNTKQIYEHQQPLILQIAIREISVDVKMPFKATRKRLQQRKWNVSALLPPSLYLRVFSKSVNAKQVKWSENEMNQNGDRRWKGMEWQSAREQNRGERRTHTKLRMNEWMCTHNETREQREDDIYGVGEALCCSADLKFQIS